MTVKFPSKYLPLRKQNNDTGEKYFFIFLMEKMMENREKKFQSKNINGKK